MYGEPGRAYLYLVYGMHTCLNVVTEPAGRPAAVLIRAVEALEPASTRAPAADRRVETACAGPQRLDRPGRRSRPGSRAAGARLAAGPGLVGAAFGLDPTMTGLDLLDPAGRLRIEPGEPSPSETVLATPRIGVDYAASRGRSLPWRLVVAGNPSVVRPARRPR